MRIETIITKQAYGGWDVVFQKEKASSCGSCCRPRECLKRYFISGQCVPDGCWRHRLFFFHQRDGKKCKGYVVEPPVNEAAYRASVIVLNSNGILGYFMYICIRDIIRVEQRNVKTRSIL